MSEYVATVIWTRDGARFTDRRYSRAHRWTFDGGVSVRASASPHIVPAPMSVADAVDPEEAFVASLASCHMLFFLSIAAERGFVVDAYRDDAVGELGPDPAGKQAMVRVTLRPDAQFGGESSPAAGELSAMHHAAHEACFISRSVTTDVRCEPVPPRA